jgi:hypothetical protein
MTARLNQRNTDFAGLTPARGTFEIAADTIVKKGWIAGLDSAGRVQEGNTIANGCVSAVGKIAGTQDIDNSTGSVLGGAAGATTVEVEYGVFGWESAGGADTILADDVGKVCYVVDNQTVGLTNGTDTRGVAGYITEVRDGQVFVHMGPSIAAQIVIAASEASQLDTAQTEIDALQADALSAQYQIAVPLASAILAAGTPMAAFADNAGASAPGITLVDSESVGIRWNNFATQTAVWYRVAMPQDLDDAAAVVLHILASKTGATDADDTTFTVTAFFQTVGALHDADADAGGASSAMVGTATAKTVAELTLSIAAGDVPAAPCSLSFSIKPTNGLLGTDDVIIHDMWFEVTRQLLTA